MIIAIIAFVVGLLVGCSSWLVAAAWLEMRRSGLGESRDEACSARPQEMARIGHRSLKRAI